MGDVSNFQKVLNELRTIHLVRDSSSLPRGHTRIETAFHYPDGSSVDLFLTRSDDLLKGYEPLELTDFGSTLSWLAQLGISPLKNQRRRKLMTDILNVYDVTEEGGALKCRVTPSELSEGLIRLGQACIRVADLSFTARFLPRPKFADEVEDVLDSAGFRYEPDATVSGQFNGPAKMVKIDFRVYGQRAETALMLLPELRNSYAAVRKAEHVFAVFYDLQLWPGHRVAALDDRAAAYQEQDLNRIDQIAQIIPFSDSRALIELLGSGARIHV
jgi:Domain of unknown function DUF1828